MTNKPVIFISATSDLRSARDLVGKVLYSMGFEPVWQEIEATDGGELLDVLRRRIEPAALVIQLVGQRYGAGPPQPTQDFGRVSYTQFEALEAERLGKKVIYHFLDDHFPVDPAAAEPPELASLQAAYRQRLKDTNRLRYDQIADTGQLELSIRRISDELAALRRQADRRQRNLARLGVAAVAGIAAVAALTFAHLRVTRSSADRLDKEVQAASGKLDRQAAEMAELRKAVVAVAAAVSPKPLAAGQTQPDPIPPEILAQARLLLERGNAEQQALGMIALKQHAAADRLIQQLKRKPGNPIDEAIRLLTLEGDNWYQAGEPDKAIGPYEQAFALKPNDFKARNHVTLALIFARLGNLAAHRQRAIDIAIAAFEAALTVYTAGAYLQQRLSTETNLSWVQLLAKDFAGALVTTGRAAKEGVVYLPLETNHAHALLLLGRTDEAQAIYLEYVGRKVGGTDKRWEQVVVQDLDDLEKNGIVSPEFSKLRELLTQAAEKKAAGKKQPGGEPTPAASPAP